MFLNRSCLKYSTLTKAALITLTAFLLSLSAYASHIVGADLFYNHVSGNTYKITLVAYGDCGPSSAGSFATLPSAQPEICIYNGATLISNISLVIDTPGNPLNGVEITPVCPSDTANTQCTNTSYAIPGIKKFVYTGTYTLPSTSHYWRFLFNGSMGGASGAGRAAAITNITTGSVIQLVDTLDNTYHDNTSPALTVVPTPFFCLNNSDSYNPGAIDGEGDSLVFALVPGMNGTSSCTRAGGPVTYIGGHSATNPLTVSAGTFSFSTSTGQLNFFPNVTQRGLVVYNVREYRNDTFIGTSQREMTFLVLTCTSPPPSGGIVGSSGSGTVIDSNHFVVCANTGSFSVTIDGHGADTSKYVKVTRTGLPAGSTFSTTNDSTTHPVSTFSWTTTGVAPGSYTFFVTFKDNNCPISGVRTSAYTITISPLPAVNAGSSASICLGSSLVFTPSGATSYVWSPGTALSCTSCSGPVASPTATTAYTVTGTDANGCVNTDSLIVTVKPVPAAITGTTSVCVGSTTTLSNSASGGAWSISSGIANISAAGVVTGITAGTATVTYTLAGGCYVTTNITVNPLPVPISGPTNVCVGATITLTDASGGGSWTSSNNSVATVASVTGVVTGVAAGTVTITYLLATGCLITTNITVNPIPAAIGGPTNVCAGSTITLTNAVAGGTWSSSLLATATIGTTSGIVTGVAAGAVTLTYMLAGGCYVTYNVTVNPRPATIGGPTAVCEGATITLTDATSGGTWSSVNTAIATIGSTTGVLYGVAAGTVTISYILPTGCYMLTAIEVNTQPAAIGGTTVVCAGSTITLTNSVRGGVWTSTTIGIATIVSTTGVLTGVSAGTASITYTMPTGGCYSATTITVNPLPIAGTISGASSVCVRSSITLTESVAGGTWSSVAPSIATVNTTGVVTGISAGIDTIKYAVTNSCGTIYATMVVTVLALPDAGTISGPTAVCVNDNISLSETIAGGTWSSSSANATISATGVVTGVTAGSTIISYSYTNACGTAIVSYSVTIKPLPTIIIGPATVDFCIGNSANLTASGGVSYVWSPSTGLNTTIGALVVASPTLTTTYIVTGTGSNGCANTTSRTVTVHNLPVLSIASPFTICYGYSATLPVSGAFSYVWSPATGLSATTGSVVVASPTDSITYIVTGTDAFGCFSSTNVVVNVNVIPPAPNVTSPVTYCKTATATSLGAGGIGLLWYTSAAGGTADPVPPIPSTADLGTNTWYVTQTVNGCESPRSAISVIVLDNAITDFEYVLKYGCTRDTVIFTNTSSNCIRYEWSYGDGLTNIPDSTTSPVHYYQPTLNGTKYYSVKLHGYNSICFDDSTIKLVTIGVNPNPGFSLFNVTTNQTINFGNSVQLNAFGAVIYYWTPNDGSLSNPNINNPVATPPVPTTYTVHGYNSDGCLDTASVYIDVIYNDSDFVPSGFTPNGDGKNDVFRIMHLKHDKLVEFNVYNRWGQLIFQTSDLSKGWDGTYMNVPQDIGVYNYMITTSNSNGENKTYKGTVTLIR